MADYSYVAVTNIPSNYHASDLRVHFSTLVETKSFTCFHFRHRPEKVNTFADRSRSTLVSDVKRCCIVKVVRTSLSQLLDHDGNNWTNAQCETSQVLCNVTPIRLKTKNVTESEDETEAVDEEKLLQMPELNPPEKMPYGNVGTPTLLFLDMIQNCLLPQSFIKKLQLRFPKAEGKRLYSNVDFDYCTPHLSHSVEVKEHPSLSHGKNIKNDSKQCKTECLHPRLSQKPFQHQVASSSEDCSIEPLAKNSESDFKTTSSPDNKSHSFSTTVPSESWFSSKSDQNVDREDCKNSSSTFKQPSEDAISLLNARERKLREKAGRLETRKMMAEGIEEKLIAVEKRYHNDEDAEEWDRHEASEDDPSNQERNKERLYETEEETPWEKGGPGVVFYTDANFWQAREGDFDEQTTDDLDVDFSAYEEVGAGDKDIKDFLRIQQEERFRNGYDSTDRFSIGIAKRMESATCEKPSVSSAFKASDKQQKYIGEFEKFSKGIGRRVMERQGWQEGQGLGKSRPGIKTALAAHGQGPRSKSGLGFKEPSHPVTHPEGIIHGRKRPLEPHLISTIYDNPKDSDPKVPLLQRAEPTTLKHRQSHLNDFLQPC